MQSGGAVRVFVVDDHEDVRGLIRRIFRDHEIDVVGEASNGRDGLDGIEALRPDIVVTDIQMPVLDGVEVTRTVKHRWPDTHVIAISARSDADTSLSMAMAGADAYVEKLNLNEFLVPTIQKLITGRNHVIRLTEPEDTTTER